MRLQEVPYFLQHPQFILTTSRQQAAELRLRPRLGATSHHPHCYDERHPHCPVYWARISEVRIQHPPSPQTPPASSSSLTKLFSSLPWLSFTQRGYIARKRSFTPGALDLDLSGRSYLVTGANSGLGHAAAKALAARGGSVHMLCRNRERGERARDAVRAAAPDPAAVQLHLCDLASLADVRRFAEEFQAADGGAPRKLDVLVNNAGLMVHERAETADGVELNFGVNVLGTYVLTELLLPCLQAAEDARVVTVSSAGMLLSGRESLREGTCTSDDLVSAPRESAKTDAPQEIDGQAAYSRNKRCQIALTEHWAERHGGSGVRFFVMHPGWASTEGLEKAMPGFHSTFSASLRTAEEGADTIVWLAAAEEALKENDGGFFLDRGSQPKHLLIGGTRYSREDVADLVARLDSTAKEKAGIDVSAAAPLK